MDNLDIIIVDKNPRLAVNGFVCDIKRYIRSNFLHYGGPQSVVDSLLSGLDEVGANYKYNPIPSEINKDSIVCVLSNIKALRWGLQAKDRKQISRLIAGPNLFATPKDYDCGAADKRIDALIFPSQWVVDLFVHHIPDIKNKTFVWASGVDHNYKLEENLEKRAILIYKKKCPAIIFDCVCKELERRGLKFEVIYYGNYRRNNYLSKLMSTKFMIFLQESETQGLAQFEAWASGVPTLVWNRGLWEFKGMSWRDKKISSPYLSEEQCGIFFSGCDDFSAKLTEFIGKIATYSPREFIDNNFSNKRCAQKFLEIASKIN